ncbi:hypothetical protein FA15DRAFT_672810 [Coprinopsis marcescibilis]|uniref:Uncharacterized protein n=1 Tax=Coprinopsis marcescibilis TaxID=230819 RepID=A0A5C3KLN8_COPMA|nr:hypothetical protein FA15DRAFT_672810 [Coprinopsis marcescibilis]
MVCIGVIFCLGFSVPAARDQGIVLGASVSSILVTRLILNIRDPLLRSREHTEASKIGDTTSEVGAFTTIINTYQTDLEADMLSSYSDFPASEKTGGMR